MNPGDSSNSTSSRKRSFAELLDADKPTTLACTVVAVDYTNLYYRVCSVCEKPLPDIIPPPATISPASFASACRHCNLRNGFNGVSSGSKHLFRVLMSVATDTKVFVVIMFDRAARVLFGCSADEFSEFVRIHPFAAVTAGKILKGELLRVTLTKPKNGNAQHLRVASAVPLRSRFQPAIRSLRDLYTISSVETN